MIDPFNPYDPFGPYDPYWPYGPEDRMSWEISLPDGFSVSGYPEYTDPFVTDAGSTVNLDPACQEIYPEPVEMLYGPDDMEIQPPGYEEAVQPMPETQDPLTMEQGETLEIWEEWVEAGAGFGAGDSILDEVEAEIEGTVEPGAEQTPGETLSPENWLEPYRPPEVLLEAEQKPVAYTPSPGPAVEVSNGPGYYREPAPKMWRPRPSKGIRGLPGKNRSRKKKKPGQSMEIRYCPEREEIVLLAECEACEHHNEGECTWEPEEHEAGNETEGSNE